MNKKVITQIITVVLTSIIMLVNLNIVILASSVSDKNITNSTNYFISSSLGDDANDGLSEATPWKSFENVNKIVLQPGDKILLNRGDTWNERLTIRGKGSEEQWIYIGPYGDLSLEAPKISLNNERDDIAIVVQDLVNSKKVKYYAYMGYIHIDNLQIHNSRIGIYFRNVLNSQPVGFKVTDCYFYNIFEKESMTAVEDKEIYADGDEYMTKLNNELMMAKGNLDYFDGVYRETGGGGAEYVFPAAIFFGGRRGTPLPVLRAPLPELRISFSDITIENIIFEKAYNGITGVFYNQASSRKFFNNINVKNVTMYEGSTIFGFTGGDGGNAANTNDSEWGVAENLNIVSGNSEFRFGMGTTGGFFENFSNMLLINCNFSNVKNGGSPDGCGFDFESRNENITITKSVFANNDGQGILIMTNVPDDAFPGNKDITIKENLFYNNLQSISGRSYKWDICIWNKDNENILLENNRHVSKIMTAGKYERGINAAELVDDKPVGERSFGDKTENIIEKGASFRRDDSLTDFTQEISDLKLQDSQKIAVITQKTFMPEKSMVALILIISASVITIFIIAAIIVSKGTKARNNKH